MSRLSPRGASVQVQHPPALSQAVPKIAKLLREHLALAEEMHSTHNKAVGICSATEI